MSSAINAPVLKKNVFNLREAVTRTLLIDYHLITHFHFLKRLQVQKNAESKKYFLKSPNSQLEETSNEIFKNFRQF